MQNSGSLTRSSEIEMRIFCIDRTLDVDLILVRNVRASGFSHEL